MIIGGGQVKMDPIKIEGVRNWAVPKTVKELRAFLGFCNFYRAFIAKFSDITKPLTKKGLQWLWGTDQQQAFDALKTACTSYPVLRTPDWSRPFILETDASGYAMAAVIGQQFEDGQHPIAFYSRSLLPAEQNYDIHDKELGAVVFGFKQGRSLFLGAQHPIEVRTDHRNLEYFRVPQKITSRQARWVTYLQDFDFHISHIPGSSNTIPDILSRRSDLNEGVNDNDIPRIILPESLFSPSTPLRSLFACETTPIARIYVPNNVSPFFITMYDTFLPF